MSFYVSLVTLLYKRYLAVGGLESIKLICQINSQAMNKFARFNSAMLVSQRFACDGWRQNNTFSSNLNQSFYRGRRAKIEYFSLNCIFKFSFGHEKNIDNGWQADAHSYQQIRLIFYSVPTSKSWIYGCVSKMDSYCEN